MFLDNQALKSLPALPNGLETLDHSYTRGMNFNYTFEVSRLPRNIKTLQLGRRVPHQLEVVNSAYRGTGKENFGHCFSESNVGAKLLHMVPGEHTCDCTRSQDELDWELLLLTVSYI